MFSEDSFKAVHKLLRRYLKRHYDVYDDSSVILGLTFEKSTWQVKAMFDQTHRGNPEIIDYTVQNDSIEKNGPWFLIGEGDTPELALASLKTRINRLLRKT